MKAITIFGLRIPITREKTNKPQLLGAEVRVKGKQPLTGTVTSIRWYGLLVTIASDPKTASKSVFGKAAHASATRKQPTFTTVWRWKVQLVKK